MPYFQLKIHTNLESLIQNLVLIFKGVNHIKSYFTSSLSIGFLFLHFDFRLGEDEKENEIVPRKMKGPLRYVTLKKAPFNPHKYRMLSFQIRNHFDFARGSSKENHITLKENEGVFIMFAYSILLRYVIEIVPFLKKNKL